MNYKIIFLILNLFAASFVFSQSESITTKKKIITPIEVSGITINTGDIIKLGMGSAADGSFKHIRFIGGFNNPLNQADTRMNNREGKVKFFKDDSVSEGGSKYYVFTKFVCIDIESALLDGELLEINGEPLNSKTKKENAVSSESTASQLLKLKELLDAGLLTREEFDEEKKKILNNGN